MRTPTMDFVRHASNREPKEWLFKLAEYARHPLPRIQMRNVRSFMQQIKDEMADRDHVRQVGV